MRRQTSRQDDGGGQGERRAKPSSAGNAPLSGKLEGRSARTNDEKGVGERRTHRRRLDIKNQREENRLTSRPPPRRETRTRPTSPRASPLPTPPREDNASRWRLPRCYRPRCYRPRCYRPRCYRPRRHRPRCYRPRCYRHRRRHLHLQQPPGNDPRTTTLLHRKKKKKGVPTAVFVLLRLNRRRQEEKTGARTAAPGGLRGPRRRGPALARRPR